MRFDHLISVTSIFSLSLSLLAPVVSAGQPTNSMNVYTYVSGNKLSNFPTSGLFFQAGSTYSPQDVAPGECFAQPGFGVSICKAVDTSQFPPSTNIRPPYSRWATDNSDGSLYYVVKDTETPAKSGRGQMVILRTSDNSIYSIPNLNGMEGSEFRWDHADPNTLYYRTGCQFMSYNIVTKSSTLVHDFVSDGYPTCTVAMNDVEGDSSLDSRYWAFMLLGPYHYGNYNLLAVVTYDKTQNRIVGTLDRALFISQGGNGDQWDSVGFRPNMVDIAPTGDRVVLLWPDIKYPVPYNIGIYSGTASTQGASTIFTITSQNTLTQWFSAGDDIRISCSAGAAILSANYPVSTVNGMLMTVDITGSGLANGTYSCSSIEPALLSIVIPGASANNTPAASGTAAATATAIATTGARHILHPGNQVVLAGTGLSALNTTVTVATVPSPTTFTFLTKAAVGKYTATGMSFRDIRWGVGIKDNDFSFPSYKGNNTVANDGPHAYALDFNRYSNSPIRVCNDQTHSGWAWALNGNPVFVCQINNSNWLQAPADTIGFTDLYTGVYTPILFHADLLYQGGFHFGRFYNDNIRGWAMMTMTTTFTDTNTLKDNVVFLELKNYTKQPRIWRAGQLFTNHVGYNTEGHGYLTRDGETFRFGGNWNGTTTSAPVNTYSIRLPNGWWTLLNQ